MAAIDILILSNGPGELSTWVRPVVQALRQLPEASTFRISLVLSPCPNASGQEVTIARSYPELDRIQAAEHFFPFLLFGKTAENWDWAKQGLVIFLGGDQLFAAVIGKRLGFKTLVYAEWETRWHQWVDRFAIMKPELADHVPARYHARLTVVGDLMADVRSGDLSGKITPPLPAAISANSAPLIGLLPGSKAAKLAQGVPLGLAVAEQVKQVSPHARFVIPVAPTLNLPTLAKFADPQQNPVLTKFGQVSAELVIEDDLPYLKTASGLKIYLWTPFPAYDLLTQCDLCLTTIGANTAELGALGVPMIVLMPIQQLDAMRAWDGIPGLLANLPGVGTLFANVINRWFLRQFAHHRRLMAWPNIWAGKEIVPELLGELQPQQVTDLVLDWLAHPDQLAQIQQNLQQVRGEPHAAQKLARLAQTLLFKTN